MGAKIDDGRFGCTASMLAAHGVGANFVFSAIASPSSRISMGHHGLYAIDTTSMTLGRSSGPWRRRFALGRRLRRQGHRPCNMDEQGEVVAVGDFYQSVDFGAGNLVNVGGSDVYVVKFSR
jgi:hypothetical protein